jgi:PAT family beta-lactamase induction signal transducer AmpG
MLGLCAPQWGATQFALLTAAAGLAGHLVGGLSGVFAEALGWAGFFAASVVAVVPAVALLFLLLRPTVVAQDTPESR